MKVEIREGKHHQLRGNAWIYTRITRSGAHLTQAQVGSDYRSYFPERTRSVKGPEGPDMDRSHAKVTLAGQLTSDLVRRRQTVPASQTVA